jgi:pimeloyl-ACP methyl ester carboxylesterase
MSAPVLHRFRGDAAELAFFEWNPQAAGREPTIFFAHATGFHGRVWDQLISHLGERHVYSMEHRGHGRSEKLPIVHWKCFGEDMAGLVRHLALEGAVGVGHSMGGHAISEAAAACPGAFERLLLVDPVVASPAEYGIGSGEEGGWSVDLLGGEQHPTAKRKNRFDSPEAMFERFRDRHPYSLFEPAALWDYCEYGLLPAPDGDGFVLACPPATEASVYMTSRTNPGVHDAIRRVEIPVVVLRARSAERRQGIMDFTTSPTWPGLADEFPNGTDVQLADLTHFMPMQDPGRIAQYVLGARP